MLAVVAIEKASHVFGQEQRCKKSPVNAAKAKTVQWENLPTDEQSGVQHATENDISLLISINLFYTILHKRLKTCTNDIALSNF